MLRSTKSATKLGIFSLILCMNMANAVEIEVTKTKNWIWFKDNGNDKPTQTPMTESTETSGKVTLDGNKYYTSTSNFISSIILNGETEMSVIQTNKSFDIGTLTLKGATSMAVAGSYVTANCTSDSQCAVFNVQNLVLDSKSGKEILLRRVNATNTTITGDGTINIGNKGTGSAENNTNLGNVVVSNGASATIKSDATATTTANSLTIDSGAKVTFDSIEGNVNIDTIAIKSGAEVAKNNGTNGNLTISSVVAEAGAKGLDSILTSDTKLTITAVKSSSIAEFLSSESTSTNIGANLNGYTLGATITHNVADNGLFKYGGDFVQIVSQEATTTTRAVNAQNNGNYTVTTSTTNLSVTPSDRFQATLDNAYLAHHILLSNTMAINNKLFFFDSLKSDNAIQKEMRANQVKNANAKNPNAQNGELFESKAENHIDSWVGYEYNSISEYGKTLNADSHSVQLGVGYLQTNFIKVGGFFRYTYLGADNDSIGNKYSAHAYNAGLYGAANVWSGGYFRGQFSYTGINAKGDYTLRNDMSGINTSGAIKDNSHYLTTSVGIAQEGIMGNIFWGSVALDITHIVPLIEESDFDDYRFSKNSITLATLSGMLGVKIFDSLIYATGQVGYVISSKDMEIDLSDRARSDFFNGGNNGTQNSQWQSSFGMVNDYQYNMIVGDIGIGAAYNFTKAFKGALYLGAGFYSESKPNFKIGMNLNYLF